MLSDVEYDILFMGLFLEAERKVRAMNGMDYVWLIAFIILTIVEGASMGLLSIWFATGALAALAASLLGAGYWLQFTVFFAVSVVMLAAIRPFCKRFLDQRRVATNADRNIGKIAVCTERIDNLQGTGAARLAGITWTARTTYGETVEPGQTVRVSN